MPTPTNIFTLILAGLHDSARRWALLGWAIALICLALLYVTSLVCDDRDATIARLQAELATRMTQAGGASGHLYAEPEKDHSVVVPIDSPQDLVAYFHSYGAKILEREVPKAEQAAFLANITADPTVPTWYSSKITFPNGTVKLYTIEVTNAVRFIVPN